jgi:hypothetical protein
MDVMPAATSEEFFILGAAKKNPKVNEWRNPKESSFGNQLGGGACLPFLGIFLAMNMLKIKKTDPRMVRAQAKLEGVYVDFSASPGMISTIKPTPINPVYQPSKKEGAFNFALWVINSMMMAIMGDGLATIPKVIGKTWLIASRKSVIYTDICTNYSFLPVQNPPPSNPNGATHTPPQSLSWCAPA